MFAEYRDYSKEFQEKIAYLTIYSQGSYTEEDLWKLASDKILSLEKIVQEKIKLMRPIL